MNDLLDADDDIESAPPPTDNELQTVRELAQQYKDLQHDIADMEERLSARKLALKTLSESTLPLAMASVGMESFVLTGGGKVVVKDVIGGSITKENQAGAFAALERRGQGDLIKHEVKLTFGKGTHEQVRSLIAELNDRNIPAAITDKEFVHPGTFSAFIREQVGRAKDMGVTPDLPPEWGVYQLRIAEVK